MSALLVLFLLILAITLLLRLVLVTLLLVLFLVLLAPLLLLVFLLLVLFLLILFLVLLFVLLLLFLQLLEKLLDPFLVLPGLGVVGPRLERGFVLRDGVFPVGHLFFLVLLALALTEERVAEVEFRGRTQGGIFGQHGFGKILRSLAVVFQAVGRRPGVELQIRGLRFHLETVFEFLPGLLVIALFIGGNPRGL